MPPTNSYTAGRDVRSLGDRQAVNFVVPRSSYEVLDDWGGDRVLSLRASGSNIVKLSHVFVPDHLVTPYEADTLVIYIPLGGIWTFSVQQGASVGLSERAVGVMLAWMIPAGLAGGAFAAWIHRRTGLTAPLCIASALAAPTCIDVATARTPLHFGLAFIIYAATYMFAISVLQTAGVKAELSGRLSAVMFGMTLVGCAIGSYSVGLLLDSGRSSIIGTGGASISSRGWDARALGIVEHGRGRSGCRETWRPSLTAEINGTVALWALLETRILGECSFPDLLERTKVPIPTAAQRELSLANPVH